jgi:riboflavin kinase/FMN adenylyltransferase
MIRPKALLIGNFDGVHRGHQQLIRLAIEAAKQFGGEAVALTFDPHPTRILSPEHAPPLLTTLARKRELLLEAGLDEVIVQPFTTDFSTLSPEAFIQTTLAHFNIRTIFVGQDFRFGKDREGTHETLTELGQRFKYRTEIVPSIQIEGEVVSSSRIRQALRGGDLKTAETLLGRPFGFDGQVIRGDGRGRTLGFATANLLTQTEALPKDGVYAVRVRLLQNNGGTTSAQGVMNIGTRPTFAAGRSIEVHLLDFNQDLYDQTLRVECVSRLRDEQKFENIEALRTQIGRDIEQARTIFKNSL